jgi:hypothetical protein
MRTARSRRLGQHRSQPDAVALRFPGALTSSVWCRAGSAFTSIASGTSCPQTRRRSMKIRGSTMLPCTHGRMRCTMPSSSLRHSARTQPTTKALFAKDGKITTPVFAIGAEKFFGTDGRSDAVRRQRRHGRHRAKLGALDHGGEPTGHHRVGYRFPRRTIGSGSWDPGVTQ